MKSGKMTSAELQAATNEAASSGDSMKFMELITQSGFLPGLVNRLANKWPLLPSNLVDQVVQEASFQTFENIRVESSSIDSPFAYTFRIADRLAYGLMQDRFVGEVDLEAQADTRVSSEEAARLLLEREHEIAQAVVHAKQLLPHVGSGKVREVAQMIIESVEMEMDELPASLIAERLNIKPAAARSLQSRALKRLRKAACDQGITKLEFAIENDTDEQDFEGGQID